MNKQAVYERARLSRDARFDGRFFVGVHTTGIYCRPVCPATPPKSENVSFYATAAAASEAGFRPCLRCRPECAPGSPAWNGSSTTVQRGLKLIRSGALEDDGIETLAGRLGVTSRHLRRLFTKHLGASPQSVAHTQRLHFAKRLIDETDLPMQEIAFASGYGSVRRFNDTFRKTYGKAPRELRRRRTPVAQGVDQSTLSVALAASQPYDWDGLLSFFQGRAIPGVEAIVDGRYARTIVIDDRPGLIEVGYDDVTGNLQIGVTGVETQHLFPVVQKIREVFDVDAPVQSIADLLGEDSTLGALLGSRPGIRVPGSWDGFELAVRAILGQQVSVKAATTLSGRIVARYGEALDESISEAAGRLGLTHAFPDATRLRRARFNNLGLVGSRAQAIRGLASAVCRADVSFDAAVEPGELHAALTGLRGIGDWTADYVTMRALKNPDAFPASDLGLLRAFDSKGQPRLKPRELKARAEAWRPWRSYAALLLWSSDPGSGG